jgi:hypothetical protein
MAMLEHQKIVLNAVADDLQLFRKELEKSLQWLNEKERSELYYWAKNNLNKSHHLIFQELINSRAVFEKK